MLKVSQSYSSQAVSGGRNWAALALQHSQCELDPECPMRWFSSHPRDERMPSRQTWIFSAYNHRWETKAYHLIKITEIRDMPRGNVESINHFLSRTVNPVQPDKHQTLDLDVSLIQLSFSVQIR